MPSTFKRKDGPFFSSLEKSLQSLNVQRQAYHGKTFVGNHVHKLLKVKYRYTLSTISVVVSRTHPLKPFVVTLRKFSDIYNNAERSEVSYRTVQGGFQAVWCLPQWLQWWTNV